MRLILINQSVLQQWKLHLYVPAVQSINHTSGYMDMYRTMSFVAKDINTIILFE